MKGLICHIDPFFSILYLIWWFKKFGRDMSNNNFGGGIPYQLPPNLQQLYVSYVYLFPVLLFTFSHKIFGDLHHYCFVCRNLANDNFNGAAPYSISLMTSLKYLWVISSYSLLDATFPNKLTFFLFLFGSIGTSVTTSFRTNWVICLDNFLLSPHCEISSLEWNKKVV